MFYKFSINFNFTFCTQICKYKITTTTKTLRKQFVYFDLCAMPWLHDRLKYLKNI